ncbi:MAG: magnesium transporter [Pelagibacteraceae bacterium]|jgi:magnesium transporter|nr:magnesium transporter [Pelagibacteraceae bacterium]HJO13481.1 magnesium transporter [Alphaproteobacteria bacterium]MBO6467208.1 magnesium transporter [Pelagibacteraceae bacterium]MBO6470313.1 magnesium transporter [Pelagibacteraceae bacterium]MBO6471275.1 magnesium transporter [Pelagibacteraceae bacterium]
MKSESDILVDKSNKDQSFQDTLTTIQKLLTHENKTELIKYVEEMHNADLAEIIQNLDDDNRSKFILSIKDSFDPEILTYLNDSLRDDVIEKIDIKKLASDASELDVDDAVDVIEDLEVSDQETFLSSIPDSERKLIEEGLNYPEDSAGRLMQRKFIAVDNSWNVGNAIDYLRNETENLPEDFYDVYLVDKADKVTGIVPLGRLMSSKRDVILNKIQNNKTRTIKVLTDQEEVAYQFTKYAMVSAPVVDDQDSIIGSITVDDVVEVIEEEREEDILKLGGVGQTDIFEDLINTIKSRFSWLLVNLLTAIAASTVIIFFQASIEKVVALAVLMPIVASMGGNAGTQTMTVAVRALATKELTPTNAIKIVIKETFVGGINGIIFALIVGIISAYWFNDNLLGIIIASAMIINLVIAGLVGTLIPISLNKINIDPALASGVILTTITDVFGFLSFLGLASIFLI